MLMIAVPSRQIFIPGDQPLARRRRSWIERLIILMSSTNGDTMLDADGNDIVDSNGDAYISDGTETVYCTCPNGGTLTGLPSAVAISGYSDGMFDLSVCNPNNFSAPVGGATPWDGTFPDFIPFGSPGGLGYSGQASKGAYTVGLGGTPDPVRLSAAVLYNSSNPRPNCWHLFVALIMPLGASAYAWYGSKDGTTPVGTYTSISISDACGGARVRSPSTLTVT